MNTATSIRHGRLAMRVRPAFLAVLVKALLRVRRVEHATPEGRFWLDPASYLGLRILESNVYEPEMLAIVKRFIRPGSTFVDLGANEGYFSVVGSTCAGPSGHVLAVEPQLRARIGLAKNIALNRCANVTVAPYAVSDRFGPATMHLTPGVNNSSSSLVRPTRYPIRRQIVDCLTLEEIFRRYAVASCDLLKIDIEGWEYEAVLGSPALFRSGRVRALVLELHPNLLAKRGLESSRITDFLRECGYSVWDGSSHLVLVHPARA